MIKARQLEVLCAVIEMGTTARAAEVLAVSQPAVSNMIRHTEDQIGFPLFLREHGRLTPTREALHIADEARHLFRQQKRVGALIEELRGGQAGKLSLVTSPSLGHGLLPRALQAFLAPRPRIRLSLEVGSVDEIMNRLVSGQSDMGLSITRPRHAALSVRPIVRGTLVAAIPEGHELALLDRVRVTDLNHVRHISYPAETPLGRLVDEVFSAEGLERRHFAEVRHTTTALELAAGGLGVALVDGFALRGRATPGLALRPIHPALPIEIHAVTSNLFPTSNIALRFQQHLVDWLEAEPEAGAAE